MGEAITSLIVPRINAKRRRKHPNMACKYQTPLQKACAWHVLVLCHMICENRKTLNTSKGIYSMACACGGIANVWKNEQPPNKRHILCIITSSKMNITENKCHKQTSKSHKAERRKKWKPEFDIPSRVASSCDHVEGLKWWVTATWCIRGKLDLRKTPESES